MVIIVEGIDRVGKTTLVEKLCKEFGYQRFRDDFRYMPKDVLYGDMRVNTEKINTLMNLIEQGFVDNIVLDRFHFTEQVYGLFDRGYMNNDMGQVDFRCGKLDNVVLVWVASSDIERSSREHGVDLEQHEVYMGQLFEDSDIKNKHRVLYKDFDEFVKELKACETSD